MFDFGAEVKDKITGFKGIVVARTEWLYGCVRIAVRSTTLKEGKPIADQWFDVDELELVKKPRRKSSTKAATGGPRRGGESR